VAADVRTHGWCAVSGDECAVWTAADPVGSSPDDRVTLLSPLPRWIMLALAAIAAINDEPVTQALVAELIDQLVRAPSDEASALAGLGAALYASAALAERPT
jgi:hypothetical protein